MSIKSVMPSSHLILGRPLLLLPPIPPSIRVFSNESTLHMRWPKYWSFSFSIIPSKEIPGLISFRMDWLDLLSVQGTLKSLRLLIPRMSMFILAISCLTTSSLPWFMNLIFQVSMQYCSLKNWTLLLSPVTSTTGYCFCFGSILFFFLELFLHWSPVAYWEPTDPESSSFSILSFCLSYCSWGSQGKNTEVVCHSLLQWTTFCQTSPPWPVHLEWPHMTWLSFIELDRLWSVWSDWLVSILPWFMDLTFQVPMQYYLLQHMTLLLPPDTSTSWHHFCFGPALHSF